MPAPKPVLVKLSDDSIITRVPSRRFASRQGYTLIELVASLVTGSLLLAGMTSSVLMSQRSLLVITNGQNLSNSQRQVLNHFRSDLREATQIDMTAPAVWSLTVPDRDNDGVNESIQYRLPTTTGASISRNAWSTETFYPTNSLLHTMLAKPTPISSLPATSGQVLVEGISSAFSSSAVNRISVSCPGTSNTNDMQIAILATGGTAGTLNGPGSGWNLVFRSTATTPQIGLWWRVVNNDSSNIEFTTTANDRLSACVIRVSGHNNLIFNSTPVTSTSRFPSSTGLTTTANNSLHFRVIAATGNNYIANYTGLARNNCLLMNSGAQDNQAVTLGVGSQFVAAPSKPPSTTFSLAAAGNSVNFSFYIPPR